MNESKQFITNNKKSQNSDVFYDLKDFENSELNNNSSSKNIFINKITYLMVKIFIFILFFYFFFVYKVEKSEDLKHIFRNNYEITDELNITEKYYQFAQEGTLVGQKREKRRENPDISIIIPNFNNEKNIKRIITSIENQSFKNIEIIFVDDASTDNSINEIEKYRRRDKRIKIIRHKTNEGLFKTRNDGVLNSKGEYIIFIEPNGLLNEEILRKIYGARQMYETDIIRFNSHYLNNNTFEKSKLEDYFNKNKVIYQPKILELSFYSYKGELMQNQLYLWGKAIKRKLYANILDTFSDFYLKQNWNLYEDSTMCFILLKKAQSYVFIYENGYIYDNEEKNINNKNDTDKANDIIKDLFISAEILFDYTEENNYEKSMAIYQLKRIIYDYNNSLELVNKGFDYFYKVLDKFENCKNILSNQKIYIEKLRLILKKFEKNKPNI